MLEAQMNERSDYLLCTLSFVVGGIAGAGAALLFAPQSGSDTRGRMGRKLRRAARSARKMTGRVAGGGEEMGAEVVRRLDDDAANDGRKRTTNGAVPSR
jgi:gas vesicle protein